jgi:hypothetical protein
MTSRAIERLDRGRQIEARDADQRPRAERRGDRAAVTADDEQVAGADLGRVGVRREGGGRAGADAGVAGDDAPVRVEDGGRVEVGRERRQPGESAGGRERRARHAAAHRTRRGAAGRRAASRRTANVGTARDNARVTFIRIAWLGTVLACVVTGVVLLISGYQGYAAVFGAVGACAAINLR